MATNVSSRNGGGQWFTALITLAAGIFLIVFHNHLDLLTWIVAAIGWLILLAGVYMVAANIFRKAANRDIWQVIVGLAALALGIWIVATPSTFSGIIIYIFALVLIIAGAWHLFTLHVLGRKVSVPFYFYFIPALLIVAGVYFFIAGAKILTAGLILVMGIALVGSAVASVSEMFKRSRCNRLDETAGNNKDRGAA